MRTDKMSWIGLTLLTIGGTAAIAEVLVNSVISTDASYTFVADSQTVQEKSGYTPLPWNGMTAEVAVRGSTLYIGAGDRLSRYNWNGSAFNLELQGTVDWGNQITDLAIAGNGDLLVGSSVGAGSSFTFVADPVTLQEKTGYTPLVWGGLRPEMATMGAGGGNQVWFGAADHTYRYHWDGSAFTLELQGTVDWGDQITDLVIAGNGDLLVSSLAGTNSYTFASDLTTLQEKTSYTPLNWGGWWPEMATQGLDGGNNVWFGAGSLLFRYNWNGSTFTEEASSSGWGAINDIELVTTIPEPTGLGLLTAGVFWFMVRRRK